jgi:hypothetical protein
MAKRTDPKNYILILGSLENPLMPQTSQSLD